MSNGSLMRPLPFLWAPGFPLDMLRCESLLGLDQATCSRVLNKNYKLLVSMAPLSNEIRPISSCTPQVGVPSRAGFPQENAEGDVGCFLIYFADVRLSYQLVALCCVCPLYLRTLLCIQTDVWWRVCGCFGLLGSTTVQLSKRSCFVCL